MSDNMQMDLFGGMHPTKETAKGWYRQRYGYDESRRCCQCRFIYLFRGETEKSVKCMLIGNDGTEDTDIRPDDYACKRWEARE